MATDNLVITIGRQFGSGGRELGRALAERLGIAYYDKALLAEAARRQGLSTEFFERNDERFPRFISGIFSFAQGYQPLTTYAGGSAISADSVYHGLADLIVHLADSAPCVIVGRTSDFVLRDRRNVVNIFVHAPMEHCVKRITSRSDVTDPAKARALAEKTNKLRANYYNFYTDKTWGAASSYHLCLDSSTMPIDKLVDVVVEYLRARNLL